MLDDKKENLGFSIAKEEEKILEFWNTNKIFEKTLEKTKNGKPFTFYDGPPFATGLPHYGHILASTIKDVIPRYQTMRGRYVRRRWGWDCHGLPIEEIVERKLGISGKKQIEEIGIKKFNETCRSMVLEYVAEWKRMVNRIGRWIDFDNSYKTMDRDYMESVWWAFKKIYDKGLIYEGRKVLPYCSRCETPVSSFEVALDNSYKDVSEEAVTVKFKIKDQKLKIKIEGSIYLLAWTTTPWTLPGNVALAVGGDIKYVIVKNNDEYLILAKDLVQKTLGEEIEIVRELKGKDLIGLEYEPLFDVPSVQSDKVFKVYAADFVNTEDGTGIVHTAVVYGEDDYQLGLREGLPVVPLLDEKGIFNDKSPELIRGQYFKKSEKIIKEDLERRGLLFKRETYTHSYPHCWRCGTMLFYNAIPAWFMNIQKVKKDLLKSNKKEINWFPGHLKHGRYEKSVEAAPDWNISRNRYWGNPIPVWKCESCGENTVVGSIKELSLERNTFYFMRHGEAENNVSDIISSYPELKEYSLTKSGVENVKNLAKKLKELGEVDVIYSSDILRTKETAEIIGKEIDVPVNFDKRIREYGLGTWNGRTDKEFVKEFPERERWERGPDGGENWTQVHERVTNFIREINEKHKNSRILVVSHGDPLFLLQKHFGSERSYPKFAELFELDVSMVDLHRPYIDEIMLDCKKCGSKAKRIPEIFDSWVEAGSMPFAEYHYPFEQKEVFELRLPAQFVAEYIAQTRAWFYVMHVISFNLFNKAPFENVVTTGTILAEDGSKMSKSKNNFPDPWEVINKYGVDALRFYLMNSVVMQADNLNFSAKDLETGYRKVLLILWNVYKYFDTYASNVEWKPDDLEPASQTILDKWIDARTRELVNTVTESLDSYDTVRATRMIAEYVDDLSTWYLRRSRGRNDNAFFATLYNSLFKTSQVISPFMPYMAEMIYRGLLEVRDVRNVGVVGVEEGTIRTSNVEHLTDSVHLTDWPSVEKLTSDQKSLLQDMEAIRDLASLGLAARQELKIPVRQPLTSLKISAKGGSASGGKNQKSKIKNNLELPELLKDEVNVKEIIFDETIESEVELDTNITEELKVEGSVRSLERFIQDVRKKRGFKVGEMAKLVYKTESEVLDLAVRKIDRKKTYLSDVEKGVLGKEVPTLDLGGEKITIDLVSF
jgi:isoleucyl-tRNA synthetase